MVIKQMNKIDNKADEKFENDYYEYKKQLMQQHPLKILFFEVTSRCNARCEHCGSSCGDFVPKNEITIDEIKGVLDDIANNKNYNPREIMVNITGGEPLMRKDLFEITDYANKLGFPWGMTSNGMLITEDVVKKMVDTNMYSISISIDGLEKTHEKFRKVPGSFKKIINGIKLMQKEPTIKDIQVTTCVNKKNLNQLEDLYKLMLDLHIKDWRLIEIDPIGRAKGNKEILLSGDDYKTMLNFIEEKEHNKDGIKVSYGCGHFLGPDYEPRVRNTPFFCGAGIIVASILSNGDIFVCPDVPRVDGLIQGNIRKDSFVDVWENGYKPYRNIERTCNKECKNCTFWKLCTGDAFHTWDFEENKPNFCFKNYNL